MFTAQLGLISAITLSKHAYPATLTYERVCFSKGNMEQSSNIRIPHTFGWIKIIPNCVLAMTHMDFCVFRCLWFFQAGSIKKGDRVELSLDFLPTGEVLLDGQDLTCTLAGR